MEQSKTGESVSELKWVTSIYRIREIEREIVALSTESKKLRLLVGNNAQNLGYDKPTQDNPLEISSITHDDCPADDRPACVVITITPSADAKNEDWNITFKDIPRI